MATVVSFHAHPDDEVLLTGGTLARAAREGHRVLVVFATDGAAGLADRRHGTGATLGARRRAEAEAAGRALGVAAVTFLGYNDSGFDPARPDAPAAADGFACVSVDRAAGRLAAILRAEDAEVLTVYDAFGGYGHPDHRRVHDVGVRAASLAGTPVVLEATVDRDLLWKAARWLRLLPRVPASVSGSWMRRGFVDPATITHCVDVRAYADVKRAAMAAHASQAGGGREARTLALFLRLPRPLFRRAFGREWFVERGRPPSRPATDDILASLRLPAPRHGATV